MEPDLIFWSHYVGMSKTSNFNKKLRGIKTDPTKIDIPCRKKMNRCTVPEEAKDTVFTKSFKSIALNVQGAKENNGQRN